MGKNYKADLHNINTIVLDYDGVLSDGTIYLHPNGEALRTANVKDGYAMQLAIKKGYRLIVISGGTGQTTYDRLSILGLTDIYLGVKDKKEKLLALMKEYDLKNENVLYVGDDIPDLNAMHLAGVCCCPKDAAVEVKEIADYVSDKKGGRGCVRDILEQVMKLHNKWLDKDAHQW